MTYQEEKQVRIKRQNSRHAISLAMQGRWREALAVNKSLLENFPNDVDAYNRLGKAHMELGEYTEAEEAYQKALELDPYNLIARKNLQRLTHLKEVEVSAEGAHKAGPQHFIEETGKARVMNLYSPAPLEVLSRMAPGDEVYLKISNSTLLMVENARGDYLGQVAPKHAQRLIKLMKGGNQYSVAVVSSVGDAISVIIREVYQDASQAGQLSFPGRRFDVAYASERAIKHEEEEEFGEFTEHHVAGEGELLPEEAAEEEPDSEE